MIKSKFKRVTSLFLATLMCVTTFAGIGSTTAYAASGEKADVYMVDFPRDGDSDECGNYKVWIIAQEENNPHIIELTDRKKIDHMIILYWD